MQEYCINSQTEAAYDTSNLYARYGENSEERMIIARCLARWKSETSGYDWNMANYCSSEQIEAYQRLRK